MFQKNKIKSPLEHSIVLLDLKMSELDPSTDEYAACVEQFAKLHAIEDPKSKNRVSPDVAVTVAANLVGIGMIIHHERANVIASKALSFVMKLR